MNPTKKSTPVVAQLNTGVTALSIMRPVAPPVYRPQPLPKVLQTKKAIGYNPHARQSPRPPVAPPSYRPQPLPRVLQTKKFGTPQLMFEARKPPVAPPVYRPQPTPAVLQRKAAVVPRIPAQPVAKSRSPEPVRRQIDGAPHRFSKNVLQQYKEVNQRGGGNWYKISDDDTLALPMESNLGSKNLYGDPTSNVVTNANARLAAVQSPLRVAWVATDTRAISISAKRRRGQNARMQYTDKNFTRIKPVHNSQGEDAAMMLLKDCGKNTRELIGGGSANAEFYDEPSSAYTTTAASDPLIALAEIVKHYFPRKQVQIDGLIGSYTTARNTGGDVARTRKALDRYISNHLNGLSATRRAKFEEDAQINKFVQPRVGEGVVIVGTGAKKTGAQKKWKFHMAPVVIESADQNDYVTLENFNTPVGPNRNTNWNFNMYGQNSNTIHDELAEQPDSEFGKNPVSIVVKKA